MRRTISPRCHTADIDGTNPQQLTPFEFGVAVKQDWAPDGRHLLFTKNGIGHPPGISANIATIRPNGTDLQFLTHYEGGDVQALIDEHSRLGLPVYIWRNGKVVELSPEKARKVAGSRHRKS
jgi:Tol biopolymer transport system component